MSISRAKGLKTLWQNSWTNGCTVPRLEK